MKGKAAIALGSSIAAVVILLLLIDSPHTSSAINKGAMPGASSAERAVAEFEAEMRKAATPSMVESLYADPVPLRKMTEQDFQNARRLYARFLDELARIKTARYRVDTYTVLEDGARQLQVVEEVAWDPPKERLDETRYEDGREIAQATIISDGSNCREWNGGVENRSPPRGWGSPSVRYLHTVEAMLLRNPEARLWETHGLCEIDNGTAGFSRLRDDMGHEVRFDTQTGLLMQERLWYPRSTTGTIDACCWQRIDNIWFPRETCRAVWGEFPGQPRRKQTKVRVFSEVVLNRPIEQSVFLQP